MSSTARMNTTSLRVAVCKELTTNNSSLKNTFLELGDPKRILAKMNFNKSVRDQLIRTFDREGEEAMMAELLEMVKKYDKLQQFRDSLHSVQQDQLVELLEKRYRELEEELNNLNRTPDQSRTSVQVEDN